MFKNKQKKKDNILNSIAIWWDNNKNVKVHLDINIWHTQESKNNYLEFGLKITDYEKIDNINIYVPYKVELKDIEDKANILGAETLLTKVLFNENLDVTPFTGSFSPVKFHNEELDDFLYCKLDIQNDIEIRNQTISININKNDASGIKTIYYRFRINKLESIFSESNENYVFLDGLFKKIGFLELNINSIRKLPSSIIDKLTGIKFESMNLFLMTNNYTSLLFQSKEPNKSRILENHIWEKYLSPENSKNITKIIAYHWKSKTGIFTDYNLFVKLSYMSKSITSWLLMLATIIILGAIGGVAGNYITKCVDDLFIDNNVTTEVCKVNTNFIQKGDQNGTK